MFEHLVHNCGSAQEGGEPLGSRSLTEEVSPEAPVLFYFLFPPCTLIVNAM